MDKMNEIFRFYKVLDLEPDASIEEVKKAYRDLVIVWHPDRFPHNLQLQKKANDKLVEINEAYEQITLHISNNGNIVKTKAQGPTYDKRSEWEYQDRKTSYDFSEMDLISLLGKDRESIEVRNFVRTINDDLFLYSYSFKEKGIEIHCESGAVKTILGYALDYRYHYM